jgi:hypothetical protein
MHTGREMRREALGRDADGLYDTVCAERRMRGVLQAVGDPADLERVARDSADDRFCC